jgi:hypothetical protein
VITDGLAGLAAELEATAYEATSGLSTTAIIRQAVAVSVEDSWAAIRGIDGLDRWFPIIHGCTVKGEGVGALRVLDIGDGAELHDQIEQVDDAGRRVVYNRVAHPFPCSRYIGTVDVEAGGHGGSTVFWTIHTDVSAENRAELSAFVFGAITDGLAGLAAELEGAGS